MGMNPVVFSQNRLRFFGMASGLDIDQIVQQLMTVARIPLDRMEQQRQLWVWKKEDYLNINKSLDELRQTLLPLKLESTFQVRQVSSSNESVATATAAPGTTPGVHDLTVTQLAKGVQLASSAAISRTSDRTTLWTQFDIDSSASPSFTLTLEVTDSQGTRSAALTFDVNDTAKDDINDVVNAINNSGLGLTASYDATLDRLFVSSQETGASVSLTVTDATVTLNGGGTATVWEDLFKLGSTAAPFTGQNAIFDLDGATGLEEPTNQFTIAGITYTLKSPGSTTITVTKDTDAVVQSIQSFVDKYNEVLALINGELGEERRWDYPPLTDAQKAEMTADEIARWEAKARQGLLRGDTLLVGIVSEARSDVSGRVQGTGSVYNSLSAVGITTGQWEERGKLYVDETKLRAALEADPDGVVKLFTASGASKAEQGVAVRLGNTLNAAIGRIRDRAGIAGVEVDGSGIGKLIRDLDDRIGRMEDYLKDLEARYYRQYSVMEQMLAQLGTQAMWLSAQFGGGMAG